jgi:hypothetical protein
MKALLLLLLPALGHAAPRTGSAHSISGTSISPTSVTIDPGPLTINGGAISSTAPFIVNAERGSVDITSAGVHINYRLANFTNISTMTLTAAQKDRTPFAVVMGTNTAPGPVSGKRIDAATWLEVTTAEPTPVLHLVSYGATTLLGPGFETNTGSGTIDSPRFYESNPAANTILGSFRVRVSTGLGLITMGKIDWIAESGWQTAQGSPLAAPSAMRFLTMSPTGTVATQKMVLTSTGTLGIGTTTPDETAKLDVNGGAVIRGQLTTTSSVTLSGATIGIRSVPLTAQTIAAGNTVTADSCGAVKLLTSAGAVTTDTSNTFTAPSAANTGCCMDIYLDNGAGGNVTLDANASFNTVGGADVVLTTCDSVRVCNNGTDWFQAGVLVSNTCN